MNSNNTFEIIVSILLSANGFMLTLFISNIKELKKVIQELTLSIKGSQKDIEYLNKTMDRHKETLEKHSQDIENLKLKKQTVMNKYQFIIQTLDRRIVSDTVHELRENLDQDYQYLTGIAIMDSNASPSAILETVKVKGTELLPEDFEAAMIMSSMDVPPNKRFFSLFMPVKVNADEIVVRYRDPQFSGDYTLQIHLLLTNTPNELTHVLLA